MTSITNSIIKKKEELNKTASKRKPELYDSISKHLDRAVDQGSIPKAYRKKVINPDLKTMRDAKLSNDDSAYYNGVDWANPKDSLAAVSVARIRPKNLVKREGKDAMSVGTNTIKNYNKSMEERSSSSKIVMQDDPFINNLKGENQEDYKKRMMTNFKKSRIKSIIERASVVPVGAGLGAGIGALRSQKGKRGKAAIIGAGVGALLSGGAAVKGYNSALERNFYYNLTKGEK